MATRFEKYPDVPYYSEEESTKIVDIGGRRITGHDACHSVPTGVSVRMPKEFQTSEGGLPGDMDSGLLSDVMMSAQCLDIPDTISVHIELRDGRAEIGVDDEATLLVIALFYLSHAQQMGVVHTGDGTGSLSIMRCPIPGTPSCGPLRGYEVIAAGAQFTLLKPIAVADALGA